MNLDELGGSALKLLVFMARHPTAAKYAREISREAGVSAGAASQGLRRLEAGGFVSRKKRGKEFFYSLRTDSAAVRQAKILFTLLELAPLVGELEKTSEKIVLFGSCARGTDTEESDVDLLVITEEKQKALAAVRRFRTAKRVAPVVVSLNEWTEMRRTDRPFYDRAGSGMVLASRLGGG